MIEQKRNTEELPILTEDEVLKLMTFEREIKPLEQKELEMLLRMYQAKQASGQALTVLEALWVKRLKKAVDDCISRDKYILEVLRS